MASRVSQNDKAKTAAPAKIFNTIDLDIALVRHSCCRRVPRVLHGVANKSNAGQPFK